MSLCGFNRRRKIEQEAKLLEEIDNIENTNIENWTFMELKKLAKVKGINTHKMKQEDILEALQTLEIEGV